MAIKFIIALLIWLLSAYPALAAVSCTVLTQSQSAVNAASITTASVTPGANRLILYISNITKNSTGCTGMPITSVTGNSLTWVSITSQCFSEAVAPAYSIEVFRAMGASPSTGTITADYGGNTRINTAWAVLECDGVDTSGTNGSGAIVQSAVNTAIPGTSVTVTLGAFGSAGNATLGIFGVGDNVSVTEGTGFTELAEQLVSDGGNDQALQVQFRNDNDTSVDASWSSIDSAGLAIEIKAAPVVDVGGDILWFP